MGIRTIARAGAGANCSLVGVKNAAETTAYEGKPATNDSLLIAMGSAGASCKQGHSAGEHSEQQLSAIQESEDVEGSLQSDSAAYVQHPTSQLHKTEAKIGCTDVAKTSKANRMKVKNRYIARMTVLSKSDTPGGQCQESREV